MKRGSPGRWVSGFGEMGYVTFWGMLLDEGEGGVVTLLSDELRVEVGKGYGCGANCAEWWEWRCNMSEMCMVWDGFCTITNP